MTRACCCVCDVQPSSISSAARPITACTFGKRSVYESGSGVSERIFSHRYTSGLAPMSDETHRIGNALIVNTPGLMKIRCSLPTSSRFSTRFASGHGSASASARTRAAIAASRTSASPPP